MASGGEMDVSSAAVLARSCADEMRHAFGNDDAKTWHWLLDSHPRPLAHRTPLEALRHGDVAAVRRCLSVVAYGGTA